jgi:hypothetical protein
MKRRKRLQQDLARQRWPLLSNLMGCFFHQDLYLCDGSLDGAVAASARDGSLDHRRAILKEWRDWNASVSGADDIRCELADCFSIAVRIKKPEEARRLMDAVYDRLIEEVRRETRRD